jgi:hypothetical protein
MNALEILAKHAARIEGGRATKAEELKGFFARQPEVKEWAMGMKEVFGDTVRMRSFKEGDFTQEVARIEVGYENGYRQIYPMK